MIAYIPFFTRTSPSNRLAFSLNGNIERSCIARLPDICSANMSYWQTMAFTEGLGGNPDEWYPAAFILERCP